MRLAWFRPATLVSDRLDDTSALLRTLESEHEVQVVDEARAHDFIRLDFRAPFDLCVYELANTRAHAFIWPYLLHVPGVLRLRSVTLHDSRAHALRRRRQDLDRELAFGGWDLVAAPVLASRVTVVSDAHAAAHLQRVYPAARLRIAPLGLGSDPGDGSSLGSDPNHDSTQPLESGREGGLTPGLTRIGCLDPDALSRVRRAVARAREAGAPVELMNDAPPERVLDEADVIVAMLWTPLYQMTLPIAGLSARTPVLVSECEHTAGWPALDPQTWRPRGWTGGQPIVISIDPRDEEHSLSLAFRRLASDPNLRHELGTAGYEWWRNHATVDLAARAWRSILIEAASLPPPPRPGNWPPHLTADGTERARDILDELAASVDFLR